MSAVTAIVEVEDVMPAGRIAFHPKNGDWTKMSCASLRFPGLQQTGGSHPYMATGFLWPSRSGNTTLEAIRFAHEDQRTELESP